VILVMSYVKAQLGGPVAGWLVPVAAANKTMGGGCAHHAAGGALLGVFVALGLPSWRATCRLVRGQILSLKAGSTWKRPGPSERGPLTSRGTSSPTRPERSW